MRERCDILKATIVYECYTREFLFLQIPGQAAAGITLWLTSVIAPLVDSAAKRIQNHECLIVLHSCCDI